MPSPSDRVERPGVPLARRLGGYGDAVALLTEDCTISYRDLAGRVEAVARQLGETRRLILIAGAHKIDLLVTYLAALSAGHPVLLAPGDRPEGLDSLVAAYRPDVVVRGCDSAGHAVLEEVRVGSAHLLHPDLALLLTTSGSTGSPKLVRLSHRNVQANAESIAQYLDIANTDRAATTLPMHYCYGLSVIHSHLLRGAGVILTSRPVTDPRFWDLFRTARGTSFAGVPYTFDLLDRTGFDRVELPDLRYITQAGGRLAPDRVRAYAELGRLRGWKLFVMYGQTEATARMAYLPPELAARCPEAIGRPVPGGTFRLEPVADGPDGTGELVYAGPNVMLGYAHSPDDLQLGDVLGGELRTGDLARQRADGLYEVVGRRSRFAKIYGLRIDLQQVESRLAEKGLRICCVGGADELVVAVENGDEAAAREAAAHATGLPVGAVRACVVDELPRTATGKPDFHAVRELGRSHDPAPVIPPKTGADTAALRAMYADILNCPNVTDDSSFVSLGGDSLSYVRMSVRLEQMIGHLPEDWHTTPIGDFTPRRRHRWPAVETNVLLRAVAIVLIVGSHIHLFAVLGGAHVLLGVAGYNFARFHLGDAQRSERVRRTLRSVARIAVPSMVFIGCVIAVTGEYRVTSAVLLNGILGPPGWTIEWRYWFVEAIVYILLAVGAVLALPLADRAERTYPFAFAMGLVTLGLLTRYAVVPVDDGLNRILTASVVFWLFALGWAAAKATTVFQRLCVTSAIVATVPGFFFGDTQREIVVIGGLCLLVWVRSVRCPTALLRVAGILASASLYIYLTHFEVYLPLRDKYPWPAFALSLLVGIIYWQAVTFTYRLLSTVSRTRMSPRRTPSDYANDRPTRDVVSSAAVLEKPGVS
ncbi:MULTISPECIES: AMP-binding protein [unclassified Rhodococcus (in: high G+C Gram-positive bacteria)]|uniref:AMP-binding protein n=1 Tax=unclassified Rhodococcus (in: high G+C Gram-positive bacteria) TaxID=192944 RepID=UPI00163AFF5F|nr:MULTISPECIES: AMP-binding protein [unclassified Rhodococcus (in: high G+C Gram-positive bacteria)]MBC2641220.1 AMP-binding protein [Rhodococcus sp. 3A]MBC2894034.1 AMP-binding protein [Rhodococcus sp. 4CII]